MPTKIKRLLKSVTIRRRAFKRGCDLKDKELGLIFTDSPAQRNTFRTLIRIQRIRCGRSPFSYQTGYIGDVFITDAALKAYGNLKERKRDASN